jgi:protoheme IX farnesyltransferase
MLPVARGEAATRRQILGYSIVMVAFTVLPYLTGLFGWIYLAAALVTGTGFIGMAAHLAQRPTRAAAVRLHLASLAYLALLFAAMAADRVILG